MNEITLQLPNNIWEPLQAFAEKSGYSTEELIKQLLVKTVQDLGEKVDPIDEFIGAFCTNIPDWGDKHDRYLGQALTEDHNA